jgi:hypothetical protein
MGQKAKQETNMRLPNTQTFKAPARSSWPQSEQEAKILQPANQLCIRRRPATAAQLPPLSRLGTIPGRATKNGFLVHDLAAKPTGISPLFAQGVTEGKCNK